MNRIYIMGLCVCVSFAEQPIARQPLLTPEQLIAQMGIEVLQDDPDEQDVNNQQLIDDIAPQLYLKSLDYIIEYIRKAPIPFAQELDLLRSIVAISISYGFTNSDITNLILGVAQGYATYSSEQDQILDVLLSVPGLLYKTNPIVIAAKRGYIVALKGFNLWLSGRSELANLQKKYTKHALLYAFQKNDVHLLDIINAEVKSITPQDATFLLWYSVDSGQGTKLIPDLIKLGGNINFVHKGKTPLIQAVMNNNSLMVQELVSNGADVNGIADLEIGSPLQQAIEHRNLDIEAILRIAGAHE